MGGGVKESNNLCTGYDLVSDAIDAWKLLPVKLLDIGYHVGSQNYKTSAN